MVYTNSDGQHESCTFAAGNHEALLKAMMAAAMEITFAEVARAKAQEEKAEKAFERARRN